MKTVASGTSKLIDLISGFLSLGLGLLVIRLSFGFEVDASDRVGGGIDAAAYPRVIAAAVIILGLILVVVGVRAHIATAAVSDGETTPANGGRPWFVLPAVFAVLILFTLVLAEIGYVIASLVLIAVVMMLLGERRLLAVAVTSIALTTAVFVVFRYGFNIVLPEGILAAG